MSEASPWNRRPRRRWRDYRTPTGRRPIRDYLLALSDEDRAAVLAAMKEVRDCGQAAARHLRGELYEVRADGRDATYRVIFATEGRNGRVLLSLHAFAKKTRKTPLDAIDVAEDRLKTWRARRRPRGHP